MRIVHVVGTGTIGEPLIGLLADYRKELGIDEVTFHKRTPLQEEVSKVNDLIGRGAKLCVDPLRVKAFEDLGHEVSYEAMDALNKASVVIDCTPAGNRNKKLYETLGHVKGFIAQGSEKGFGKPYALDINDCALAPDDRFVQVVSCNTHNISVLLRTLGFFRSREYGPSAETLNCLKKATFVCMRRANDISQADSFIASPEVGSHSDARFGTHHARDAHDLFETIGWDLDLWSSSLKLNTQYMHALWFSIERQEEHAIGLDEAMERLEKNDKIALTYKTSANQVFSFGRDHGYYGRILNQTVISRETVAVDGNAIVGFCFTPQDGNSLLSSAAAALRFLYPEDYKKRLKVLSPYLYDSV